MLHPTKAGAQAGGLGFQKLQAGPKATSGQAQGLAWPGFWPQARAGTSLAGKIPIWSGTKEYLSHSKLTTIGRNNVAL